MFNLFFLAVLFLSNLGANSTTIHQCPIPSLMPCQPGTISVQLSTNPSINYEGLGICPPAIRHGCETPPPPGERTIGVSNYIGGDQCPLPIGGGWSREACPLGKYYGIIGSTNSNLGGQQCKEYRFGCKDLQSSNTTSCPTCPTPQCPQGLAPKQVAVSPTRGNCQGCAIFRCQRTQTQNKDMNSSSGSNNGWSGKWWNTNFRSLPPVPSSGTISFPNR